jgi:hypothetical protein
MLQARESYYETKLHSSGNTARAPGAINYIVGLRCHTYTLYIFLGLLLTREDSCDDSWEAATSVVAEEAIAAYNASVANINVADRDDSSDDSRPLSLLLGRR